MRTFGKGNHVREAYERNINEYVQNRGYELREQEDLLAEEYKHLQKRENILEETYREDLRRLDVTNDE